MSKQYRIKCETGKFYLKGGKINIGVKRGNLSLNYFSLAYTILLAISIGLIAVLETTSLNKIILIVFMAYILYRCCFFKDWYRRRIINLFNKSKEHIEK